MKRKVLLLTAISLGSLMIVFIITSVKFSARAKETSATIPAVVVQEDPTVSVPFKGPIDKEGRVRLILRIYNMADGGTKLFEEIQEVDVSDGLYVTNVEVPSEVIPKNKFVWLEATNVIDPSKPLGARTQFGLSKSGDVSSNLVLCAGSCISLCYTCGGAYPIYAGSTPLPAGSKPHERGASCSGSFAARADRFPQLCSK